MLIFIQYLPEQLFNFHKQGIILKLRISSLKPRWNLDFVRGTLKVPFDMTGHIFTFKLIILTLKWSGYCAPPPVSGQGGPTGAGLHRQFNRLFKHNYKNVTKSSPVNVYVLYDR